MTTVNGRSIIWDTHKDNFDRMKKTLVPPMEQAYVALLDDLSERGLLDTTLVIWMGDFGRTPMINKDAGRDHWPQCYSVVLAGGGIRGGQVIGQSDRTGAFPHAAPRHSRRYPRHGLHGPGLRPARHHLPHRRRPPHAALGRNAASRVALRRLGAANKRG